MSIGEIKEGYNIPLGDAEDQADDGLKTEEPNKKDRIKMPKKEGSGRGRKIKLKLERLEPRQGGNW